MNRLVLLGRLTKDPACRVLSNVTNTSMTTYTLAVDRKVKKQGEQSADFINCVCFGKTAEFAEKYFHKGIKIVALGRIQSGSYINKDGQKVYTIDMVVEEQEFAESKRETTNGEPQASNGDGKDGFVKVPEGTEETLPFN